MSGPLAYLAPRIFDGERWHLDAALLVRSGLVEAIVARRDVPAGATLTELAHGLLAPGFVDLQVNGGGGVQFNEQPTLEGIRRICDAHRKLGTAWLLPTLISDTPEVLLAALDAGAAAARQRIPGFLGLHLEGPHLAPGHQGAHDVRHLRPMTEGDVGALLRARPTLPHLLITLAPEMVTPHQIGQLVVGGVVVSLGHSGASLKDAQSSFAAGASMVTHLFNAMSQLGSREPGLVGAALMGTAHAGIIADGIHVHPANLALAHRTMGDLMFVVTDAMAPAGTDRTAFALNGREVHRANGALRLADGTLAGADLTMPQAVRMMSEAGAGAGAALRMGTVGPAIALGSAFAGRLAPRSGADFVHLDDNLNFMSARWASDNGTGSAAAGP
jgi:N-acetylglucosamine-6-phosphate deacetylase